MIHDAFASAIATDVLAFALEHNERIGDAADVVAVAQRAIDAAREALAGADALVRAQREIPEVRIAGLPEVADWLTKVDAFTQMLDGTVDLLVPLSLALAQTFRETLEALRTKAEAIRSAQSGVNRG